MYRSSLNNVENTSVIDNKTQFHSLRIEDGVLLSHKSSVATLSGMFLNRTYAESIKQKVKIFKQEIDDFVKSIPLASDIDKKYATKKSLENRKPTLLTQDTLESIISKFATVNDVREKTAAAFDEAHKIAGEMEDFIGAAYIGIFQSATVPVESGGGENSGGGESGGSSGGSSGSSSSGGGYTRPHSPCFVAGTKVYLKNGFKKNIEDVVVGDIVLSYNENTKQNEYSEVIETMVHNVRENIYSIFVGNDVVRSTGIHKFYIKRDGKIEWISADNLVVGDLVLLSNGEFCNISKIEYKIESTAVFNLEVSNTHNYYVGENSILVHNKR